MLTIRREQMAVFEQESWRRLALQAGDHLRTYFPKECAAMSEHALTENIDAAILRARRHGLESTYDFLRYLNLAVVFGWDFDHRQPWAAEILTNHEFGAHTRMDLLAQRGLDELHWVEEDAGNTAEAPVTADEEQAVELDGLENEEPGESIDGDSPEPLQWEPEEPPPAWELDPEIDYTAHESDFHDG